VLGHEAILATLEGIIAEALAETEAVGSTVMGEPDGSAGSPAPASRSESEAGAIPVRILLVLLALLALVGALAALRRPRDRT
jgi:hypothetical protein